jgi:Ca2+/Na+ antiporter
MDQTQFAQATLLYFILPLWLLVSLADYLCHRATNIAETTGYKESLLHLLMFAEVAVPLLAALFLEINALVILTMIAGFVVHQLTALWDVSFAIDKRDVTPIEQHIHSFLEMLPLLATVIVIILHWPQFMALFGAGPETARFSIAWKPEPLPWGYVTAFLAAVLVFEVLPYAEELLRGLRARAKGG